MSDKPGHPEGNSWPFRKADPNHPRSHRSPAGRNNGRRPRWLRGGTRACGAEYAAPPPWTRCKSKPAGSVGLFALWSACRPSPPLIPCLAVWRYPAGSVGLFALWSAYRPSPPLIPCLAGLVPSSCPARGPPPRRASSGTARRPRGGPPRPPTRYRAAPPRRRVAFFMVVFRRGGGAGPREAASQARLPGAPTIPR